jgi:hypothetical protein
MSMAEVVSAEDSSIWSKFRRFHFCEGQLWVESCLWESSAKRAHAAYSAPRSEPV